MKERKKDTIYEYWIEDGQFSRGLDLSYLIGNEGDKVRLSPRGSDYDGVVYILFINGTHVECIGNTERTFPKSSIEHNELKNEILSRGVDEEEEQHELDVEENLDYNQGIENYDNR